MNRTPLARKRATPRRRPAVQCSYQRCYIRPYVGGLCKTHATREADALFSLAVRARDQVCTARLVFPQIVCAGELQCMHLVSRRYHSVRWSLDNARAGCKGHHAWLTLHPERHYDFCEAELGPAAYRKLRDRAYHGESAHLGDVLEQLRAAAA